MERDRVLVRPELSLSRVEASHICADPRPAASLCEERFVFRVVGWLTWLPVAFQLICPALQPARDCNYRPKMKPGLKSGSGQVEKRLSEQRLLLPTGGVQRARRARVARSRGKGRRS
jgi:hypothetical protein